MMNSNTATMSSTFNRSPTVTATLLPLLAKQNGQPQHLMGRPLRDTISGGLHAQQTGPRRAPSAAGLPHDDPPEDGLPGAYPQAVAPVAQRVRLPTAQRPGPTNVGCAAALRHYFRRHSVARRSLKNERTSRLDTRTHTNHITT